MSHASILRATTLLPRLIAVALLSIGCTKSQPKSELEQAMGSAEPQPEAAVPAANPVADELQKVVDNCSINERHAVVSKCKNKEKQTLIRGFTTGKLSRVEALPTLVDVLGGSDPKLAIAAAKVLESAFRTSFGKVKEGDVKPEVALKMLQLLTSLPKRLASQAAPATVHAAMISGQQDKLYQTLDNHPNDDLRASAYVYLMRYGSINELPKVKSLTASPDSKVAAAGLESLRSLPGKSAAEKKQVCDFIASFVSDARVLIAGKAVSLLTSCGDDYAGLALDEVEKRYKDNNLSSGMVRGLNQLCLKRRDKTFGSPQQCVRTRTLLEQLVGNQKLTEEIRQFALVGLGLQFPDERTRKLAEKYKNADGPRLRSAAKRLASKLGRRAPTATGTDGSKPVVPAKASAATLKSSSPTQAKKAAPAQNSP